MADNYTMNTSFFNSQIIVKFLNVPMAKIMELANVEHIQHISC